MYDQNSNFKTTKNSSSNSPIYLYCIEDYDGASTNLYLAEYDTDIDYDNGDETGSHTYTKFPIKHEEIGENTQGEIDTIRVSVANVNRIFQAYLENYDLRGKKVIVTLVWANQLADTDAHIDFIYYIDNYSSNQNSVDFVLSSKYDVIDLTLPNGVYNRNYCRWKYNSTECGHSGAPTTCDKRKTTCKTTMNNIARYGGFPSIPTGRLFT